jgi:hypothetical protein
MRLRAVRTVMTVWVCTAGFQRSSRDGPGEQLICRAMHLWTSEALALPTSAGMLPGGWCCLIGGCSRRARPDVRGRWSIMSTRAPTTGATSRNQSERDPIKGHHQQDQWPRWRTQELPDSPEYVHHVSLSARRSPVMPPLRLLNLQHVPTRVGDTVAGPCCALVAPTAPRGPDCTPAATRRWLTEVCAYPGHVDVAFPTIG